MNKVLDLACQLISRPSVTPNDAGCQDLIAAHLTNLGFSVEFLRFGQVTNLWAKLGDASPTFCFAGHTDVVPPGDISKWHTSPFRPTVRGNRLVGRGVADMKAAIAAFLVATETFLHRHTDFEGAIAFLLTSDEEGEAKDGTLRVVETLQARHQAIDFCLIGEPTSKQYLGDTIKVGSRGSLTGHLVIKGKQGHIAYPHLAINPIHGLGRAIRVLSETTWDTGNQYFEPTSWQACYLHADSGAVNVIPQSSELTFNFRFSVESTVDSLKKRLTALLDQQHLQYEIHWTLSSNPFIDEVGYLAKTLQATVGSVTGQPSQFSTKGGASDGHFLCQIAKELLEFGLLDSTIHQTNECSPIEDINQLTAIYTLLLQNILCGQKKMNVAQTNIV
ncbi:MAG: succinyl-diaminopimelate desuccinylase [Neisseriales bacterium]|nr:MAG: succinyl-diaminopimelate desuccinylase [Neisseriales bacterium]